MRWLRDGSGRLDVLLMAALVAFGLSRLAPDLGHQAIWAYDESFHQVVTRHTFDNPLEPKLYDDPVHDNTEDMYWQARVWLIKPPGAFWMGALMMLFTGPVPLAFRLGGLLSQLLSALTIYWLAKGVANRGLAFVAGLAFLALPSGWVLTQAHFVGDELDLLLAGWICVSMLLLLVAVRTGSLKWAALAGAATGAAFLVKTVLALTPLGVAGCLWVLRKLRFCPGPKLRAVVVMAVVAAAVALPWNVYAYLRWPQAFIAGNADVLGHLLPSVAAERIPMWRRPVDAVFNEINRSLYGPVPHALTLVVGVWLVVRAVRRRDAVTTACALWLWATWIGHSLPAVKMYSHLWNSTVPGMVGVAVVLKDVWRSRGLALVAGATAWTQVAVVAFPALARLREPVPPVLYQTRDVPGLVEGLLLAGVAAVVGVVLSRLSRSQLLAGALGLFAFGSLTWQFLFRTAAAQVDLAAQTVEFHRVVYSREVGLALEAQTPKRSLVMLDTETGPAGQIEPHNLMFWSDRLVHVGRDPADYPQAGFHPYLVSAEAEPYAPLDVPAHAWLRAYDLARPISEPAPLPEGVKRLGAKVPGLDVLGVARGPFDAQGDHWAFYVRSDGSGPGPLLVTFVSSSGRKSVTIAPEAALLSRGRLARAAWFVLPTAGPRAEQVPALLLGPEPGVQVQLE